MADYDPAVLRRLQLTILDILKDIDSICKENNIEYYIAYGTALGAVRHGGFIPWDDDIDICMTREAYDRFLEVMPNAMPEKYDLLDIKNTNKYSMCFAKVSKREQNLRKKLELLKDMSRVFSLMYSLWIMLLMMRRKERWLQRRLGSIHI